MTTKSIDPAVYSYRRIILNDGGGRRIWALNMSGRYLKGNMTSKTFIRATRPPFVCASPITNPLKFTILTDSYALEELDQSETFNQTSAAPYVG